MDFWLRLQGFLFGCTSWYRRHSFVFKKMNDAFFINISWGFVELLIALRLKRSKILLKDSFQDLGNVENSYGIFCLLVYV